MEWNRIIYRVILACWFILTLFMVKTLWIIKSHTDKKFLFIIIEKTWKNILDERY